MRRQVLFFLFGVRISRRHEGVCQLLAQFIAADAKQAVAAGQDGIVAVDTHFAIFPSGYGLVCGVQTSGNRKAIVHGGGGLRGVLLLHDAGWLWMGGGDCGGQVALLGWAWRSVVPAVWRG